MIRKLSVIFLAAGFVLGGTAVALACGGQKTVTAQKYRTVDATLLASWIDDEKTKVFHAASAETFAAGTLPTAVRVEYDSMTAEVLGADKDARMTFLCANTMCSASKKAALAAVDLGYTDVHVFKDGVAGWKAAGKDLVVTKAPAADAKTKVRADG